MIDDGTFALSIIGYKIGIDQKRHLLLADPHIKSNKKYKNAGIYEVILDKFGTQVSNNVLEDVE